MGEAMSRAAAASGGALSTIRGGQETEMADGLVRRVVSSSYDEPISYPDNAMLEEYHVAAWMRVSLRTVQRLDLPWFYLGDRIKRVLASDVVDFVKKKRVA